MTLLDTFIRAALGVVQPAGRDTLAGALAKHHGAFRPGLQSVDFKADNNDLLILEVGFGDASHSWSLFHHSGQYHCRIGSATSGAKDRRVDAIVHAAVNFYDEKAGRRGHYGRHARYVASDNPRLGVE